MIETKTVKALLSDGATEECRVDISKVDGGCLLTLTRHDGRSYSHSSTDWYSALQDLRVVLEGEGLQLLCVGARKDVAPSRMSRDMGGGRKAYLHPRGGPPALPNLLDIFDDAAPEIVGTVEEQREYLRKWYEPVRELWAKSLTQSAG